MNPDRYFIGEPPADRDFIGLSWTDLVRGIRDMHIVGAKILAERDAYLANLTATQARSTEVLKAFRASKFSSTMLDGVDEPMRLLFAELAAAILRARAKHPKGSAFVHLIAEVGEVARAHLLETPERVREELIDVATVALRLFMGEECPDAQVAEPKEGA